MFILVKNRYADFLPADTFTGSLSTRYVFPRLTKFENLCIFKIDCHELYSIVSEMNTIQREKLILKYVIDLHIRSGMPVGSRMLARLLPMEISAATIRNVMADLEDRGFLAQPHHSAGRVPTDKGYRAYVNEMLDPEPLPADETAHILQTLNALTQRINRLADGMNDILISSSKVLANISNELGIILAPRFNQSVFEKLNFYKLESGRILVELNLANGFVKTVIWDISSDLSADDLRTITQSLNEQLGGLSIDEIRRTIGDRTAHLNTRLDQSQTSLIRLIVQSAKDLFNFDHTQLFRYSGANNIISKPDFSNPSELLSLMNFLEDAGRFSQLLLDRSDDQPFSVTIGGENSSSEISNCSLVTANYRVGEVTGQIGVVGPKRMPYSRIIPLVRFTAKTLEHIINQTASDTNEVIHV